MDSSRMDIWVTYPDEDGRYPAIVLLHDEQGINTYIKSVAERLRRAGYVVLVPDLLHHGAGKPFAGAGKEIPYAWTGSEALFLSDIRSVLEVVHTMKNVEHGSIGVLGFGMGGAGAFIANGHFRFSAGVSYYPCGMERLADTPTDLQSPHLFFWAGRDAFVPTSEVDRVADLNRNHGRDFTSVTISYAEHGFHRDEDPCYHPLAARQAWMHTLAFLEYLLKL